MQKHRPLFPVLLRVKATLNGDTSIFVTMAWCFWILFACADTQGGQKTRRHPPSFWRYSLSLVWSAQSSLSDLSSKPLGSTLLWFQHWGYKDAPRHLGFFKKYGFWWPNSRPPACVAGTSQLSLRPSPRSALQPEMSSIFLSFQILRVFKSLPTPPSSPKCISI